MNNKLIMIKYLLCLLAIVSLLISAPHADAGTMDVEIEGGAAWFSQNNVRVPGDTGTKFDMLDLTGSGPQPYIRLYATYEFNPRHALRLTLAPFEIAGTGTLNEDVTFEDTVFPASTKTKGTYRFNTYRLTYRWTFHRSDRWHLGLGAAALIRDAKIQLEQSDRKDHKNDLGIVPLLHLYAAYLPDENIEFIFDLEGAWSPQGRAVDAALKARYTFDAGWYAEAGYRTLEGGADNDTVYTFAWIHYALAAAGYRF